MAAKPTLTAPWDTTSTNLIAPTAGHQANGFAVNEVPSSSEINGQLKRLGDWTVWLNEAELNDGNTAYALTGNVDNWDPTGLGNTTNVHTIAVTPDGASYSIRGLVGGVDRREIDIINTGTFGFYLEHEEASATAANRYVFPTHTVVLDASVYLPPGASVRVRYRSTTSRWHVIHMCGVMNYQQIIMPAASFSSGNTATQLTALTGHVPLLKGGDAAAYVYLPVHLPAGGRVYDFLAYVKKASDAGTEISATLVRRESNSETTANLVTQTINTNAPGYTPIGGTAGLYQVPATNQMFYAQIVSNNNGATDWLLYARITGWFPCS